MTGAWHLPSKQSVPIGHLGHTTAPRAHTWLWHSPETHWDGWVHFCPTGMRQKV